MNKRLAVSSNTNSVDLSKWCRVDHPGRETIEGRYARLEPLDPERHGADLLASGLEPGADDRFRYLFDEPPFDPGAFQAWLQKSSASSDPMFFAVVDKKSNRAHGRQSFMRIDSVHGVIEVGNILWGPAIARTRVATEALYLFATYAFDKLGYRRLEWKCDNLNEPSKKSAQRFGFNFEGVFRQHMVVKGLNRDTAWFAMIDKDWPDLKAGYDRWLEPSNFDDAEQQRTKLAF